MQEKETKAGAGNEDEISLVDLIAVLLRHRRLILFLPLAVTFTAGIYLFALGGRLGPAETYKVQLSVHLAPMPADLLCRVEVDPVQVVNAYFSNLPTHKALYASQYPEERAKLGEAELNAYLKTTFIGKRFTHSYDAALRRYTISLSDSDSERAGRYLEALGAGATAILNERLAKGYSLALGILEAQIAEIAGGGAQGSEAGAVKASLSLARERLLALRADARFPIEAVPERLVFFASGGGGRAKTLFLVFFASGFLALLSAFLLETVRKIRNDPSARKKLGDALGA
ncbi:MAG: hypothetical protein JNG85_04245 [Spirochaetaceae bacterium]|nr:hypothetical protein [Spirochaetaceae bacterium]